LGESCEQCQQHTGMVEAIGNIKSWQQHHEGVVHTEINKNLEDLSKRLPLWATFMLSFLAGLLGATTTALFKG